MNTGEHFGNGDVRIGIDFGAGTTVIAINGPGGRCTTMAFPGISREVPGDEPVHIVPSLIQYDNGSAARFGDGVVRAGAGEDPGTARWIRRYLVERSPVQIAAGGGRMVQYGDAAADFLLRILSMALEQHPGAGVVFALPHDAPEEYTEVMQRVAREADAASCAWVDEYQAAASGYGFVPAAKEPFLILSFTMDGMEATVLVPDENTREQGAHRVLGTATGTTGCRAVDTWIVQDLHTKFRLLESDPRAIRLAPQMQYAAARVRERLPSSENEEVRLTDEISGRTFAARYTLEDIAVLLVAHNVFGALLDCIDRALSALQMRGGDPDRVRTVLLTGEGCALPAVQEIIRSRMPSCTIHATHPLDAVARGAAIHSRPTQAPDRIARSYALRYWDPGEHEHHYRFLVHRGTRYPSAGQVARIVISAAYDGQTHLSIPLYEIGDGKTGETPAIELVSTTCGGIRMAGPAQDTKDGGHAVHANERSPTLLVADPPGQKGEPRFECTFTIDPERNLCLSARDLVTGTLVKLNTPVFRMT